jgi:hypothetical protein
MAHTGTSERMIESAAEWIGEECQTFLGDLCQLRVQFMKTRIGPLKDHARNGLIRIERASVRQREQRF